MKLTAAQRRYETDFDKKVRFRPVIAVGDSVYVDRLPRPLTNTRRGDLPSDGGAPSVKLLPKMEGPFPVRSATETTVVVDQDGVSNRESFDRVAKMPPGPHDATVAASTTDPLAGIPDSTAEYVVGHLVAHREARNGSQYKVRWYGYTPADDTWAPAEGLPQPFIDCFWRARAAARHYQNRCRTDPARIEETRRLSDPTRRRSRTPSGGLRLTLLGVDKIAALFRAQVSIRETKPNGEVLARIYCQGAPAPGAQERSKPRPTGWQKPCPADVSRVAAAAD